MRPSPPHSGTEAVRRHSPECIPARGVTTIFAVAAALTWNQLMGSNRPRRPIPYSPSAHVCTPGRWSGRCEYNASGWDGDKSLLPAPDDGGGRLIPHPGDYLSERCRFTNFMSGSSSNSLLRHDHDRPILPTFCLPGGTRCAARNGVLTRQSILIRALLERARRKCRGRLPCHSLLDRPWPRRSWAMQR